MTGPSYTTTINLNQQDTSSTNNLVVSYENYNSHTTLNINSNNCGNDELDNQKDVIAYLIQEYYVKNPNINWYSTLDNNSSTEEILHWAIKNMFASDFSYAFLGGGWITAQSTEDNNPSFNIVETISTIETSNTCRQIISQKISIPIVDIMNWYSINKV